MTAQRPCETPPSKQSIHRRKALQLLGSLGGAVLGTLVLPTRWSSPRLEFGVLPAHADCSQSSSAECGPGAVSVAFDGASPANAFFGASQYAVLTARQYQVQFDKKTNNVTITPAAGYAVDSASAGTIIGGVLSYTWSPSASVNSVNLITISTSPCGGVLSWRVTVDVEIVTTGQSSTLNVRNLSSSACALN